MTPVNIKGGDNDTIITFTLELKSLRDFSYKILCFKTLMITKILILDMIAGT